MNKYLLIIGVLFLSMLNINAEETCITGYACSLEDMKKQENQQTEQDKQVNKNTEEKQKEEKKEGIFVDGGKYNKPEYTEMFTKYDLLP